MSICNWNSSLCIIHHIINEQFHTFFQERGEFDIETSTVFESNKEIIKIKLQGGEDMKSSEISESYQKFLQHCNYVDTCDVFNLVQKALVDNEDLRNDLSRNRFLFFGLPTDPVEVIM